MPAKSQSQQRLMAAAEHGANFPKAKALRASMTMSELPSPKALSAGIARSPRWIVVVPL